MNILLLEPSYPNKYPPLGLMKLAAYHGPHGRGDDVVFVKGPDPSVLERTWDRVYVTTLFTFEWERTVKALDFAVRAAGGDTGKVWAGGISVSLMHDAFLNESRWEGVRFVQGLLDGPPTVALRLSASETDNHDLLDTPIEELVPDYRILDQIDYQYPVHDAYFGYASRGCIRKCSFCGVPKLEGGQKEMPPLHSLVEGVSERYGEKKDLVLMDNNITASARYQEVIAEIRDLGFTPGAKLSRDGRRPVKRRVDFNQGVDARILAKSPMFLREMSTICISPLRIAFDHIGTRKVYETSVRMAADNNITSLSNYMLYNFMDTPEDLYRRLRLNIELNTELDLRIWSFPMRYQPVTLKDRSHIGKHWNWYFLRSFQMMLQATRGVVGGDPDFFEFAYGENEDAFLELLTQPHAFIFFRKHYDTGEGKSQRDEYDSLRRQFTPSQQQQFMNVLLDPRPGAPMGPVYFREMTGDLSLDSVVRDALWFHTIDTSGSPASPHVQLMLPLTQPHDPRFLDEDEIVEDAGLFDMCDS